MIHDLELTDKLSVLPHAEFDGRVFRATGESADPTAFSNNGGR